MKIQNFRMAMLLPGFGCWSQDRTTARLGKTNKGGQRDSLAFELTKKETILQKIDYIHYNPTDEKWKLCIDPVDYYYSSAKFYESGVDDFGFLKHIGDVL